MTRPKLASNGPTPTTIPTDSFARPLTAALSSGCGQFTVAGQTDRPLRRSATVRGTTGMFVSLSRRSDSTAPGASCPILLHSRCSELIADWVEQDHIIRLAALTGRCQLQTAAVAPRRNRVRFRPSGEPLVHFRALALSPELAGRSFPGKNPQTPPLFVAHHPEFQPLCDTQLNRTPNSTAIKPLVRWIRSSKSCFQYEPHPTLGFPLLGREAPPPPAGRISNQILLTEVLLRNSRLLKLFRRSETPSGPTPTQEEENDKNLFSAEIREN